jgi:hypothetical protein
MMFGLSIGGQEDLALLLLVENWLVIRMLTLFTDGSGNLTVSQSIKCFVGS